MAGPKRLSGSVRELPGIGPVTGEALEKAGFWTLRDLLTGFPAAYRDYTQPADLSEARPGVPRLFRAVVASAPKSFRRPGGPHILRVRLCDPETEVLADCTIFNQPYMAGKLKTGETVFVDGTPRETDGRLTFSAPSLLTKLPAEGIVPVYRTPAGITPARFRSAVKAALDAVPDTDPLSRAFLKRYDVMDLPGAYEGIHRPRSMAQLERAQRRFSLEEGLITTRTLDLIFAETAQESEMIIGAEDYLTDYLQLLHVEPTAAQLRCMREIGADLGSGRVMNRLLEGDVGSGKTLVAFFAMYAAMREGYQGILMAPTEVLARQHAAKAAALFGEESTALLLGSQRPPQRRKALASIQDGQSPIVIGTHALLYGVDFHRPALLVTDEQHRFGVQQRRRLLGTDKAMHSLIMSATPIPRSLSLALHGITSISILDELPPGRQPVLTRLVGPRRMSAMFDYLARCAAGGGQGYIVCPLIEESETMELHSAEQVFADLTARYPEVRFGLLHGRMDAMSKQLVMDQFAAGEISVLITTTVIEVGIDVPAATMMIILDAERFGLAQLHQLRGRVGRGAEESWCFLCSGSSDRSRLEILCRTDDGFAVAEADMRERGVGEFLGWQQSGRHASGITVQEPGLIIRFRDMLNEMAADASMRRDFSRITKLAQKRIADRFETVALN